MGGSSGYTLPEGFDPVGEGWTPPVGVQRRQVVAPPEGYRPGIDPEWNYFGSTLNPPADPTGPITDPIFTYPGVAPTFPPGWNPYDIDLGIDFQENGGGFDFGDYMPDFTMPEIDYDLLAGAIDMPSFQMPDYTDLNQQLLDLQGGIGGLEAQFQDFQMPSYEIPNLDYDLLASNLAGNINMPTFEMPDYSQDFLNLGTTLGDFGTQLGNLQMPTFDMPNFDYDLLAGNIAGNINMPSYDMPDYTQLFQDLQGSIGGLGTQIGGIQMPSFEMPDYSQQFANIQSGLGGLGSQIGNMPSFQMPDYSQQFADIQTGLGGIGQQIGNMPSFQMPNYNQQFENLQQQIGGLGYGGPSLEDIQGIMPSYQTPDYSQDLSAIMSGINALQPQQYVPENPYGFGGVGFAKGGPLRYFGAGDIFTNKYFTNPILNPTALLTSDTGTAEWTNPVAYAPHVVFQNLEQAGEPAIGMPFGSYGKRINEYFGWEPPPETLEEYEKRKKEELERLFAESPENIPVALAKGGKIPRYQEGEGIAGLTRELGGTGGQEAMMTEGNEQLIQVTVQAILGMLPDQQTVDVVIQKFIGLYGQEAFTALRERVLQSQSPGAQTEGLIEGFGGGMDDFVPGIAGSQERIATSPGEYIVPADVVSQLGDGNSNEGSRKLDGMSKRVRMAKTGTVKQAKPIDSKKVLPV